MPKNFVLNKKTCDEFLFINAFFLNQWWDKESDCNWNVKSTQW